MQYRIVLLALCLLSDVSAQRIPAVADLKAVAREDDGDREIIARFMAAVRVQEAALRGVETEMEIAAKVPRLQKEARLRTLRTTSVEGRVAFHAISSSGDGGVRREIIARYLALESQPASGAAENITPTLYKFKRRTRLEQAGRLVHVFRLEPRKKAAGLFKGELWIDDETGMPLRESGQFVRNPSIVLKSIRFTREFEIRDGIAVPMRTAGIVETRMAGTVELNIGYRNFSCLDGPAIPDRSSADSPLESPSTQHVTATEQE